MKTFKKTLIIFLILLLPFMFSWFFFGFVQMNFNFANWRTIDRGLMLFFSTMVSFSGFAFLGEELTE
jgi:hypothetical protein